MPVIGIMSEELREYDEAYARMRKDLAYLQEQLRQVTADAVALRVVQAALIKGVENIVGGEMPQSLKDHLLDIHGQAMEQFLKTAP